MGYGQVGTRKKAPGSQTEAERKKQLRKRVKKKRKGKADYNKGGLSRKVVSRRKSGDK